MTLLPFDSEVVLQRSRHGCLIREDRGQGLSARTSGLAGVYEGGKLVGYTAAVSDDESNVMLRLENSAVR
jgi:hypothetical protein